jgi:hypothetical protein
MAQVDEVAGCECKGHFKFSPVPQELLVLFVPGPVTGLQPTEDLPQLLTDSQGSGLLPQVQLNLHFVLFDRFSQGEVFQASVALAETGVDGDAAVAEALQQEKHLPEAIRLEGHFRDEV